MAFSVDLVVERNAAVLEASIGHDHVLFHPDTGTYCHLNEIGAEVWNILIAPHTLPALMAALGRKYAVDHATCQTDTLPFLTKLKEGDFVSLVEQ